MIDTLHITGLVLAGGRGSRMGGVDKGLQPHAGQPLGAHALRRLAPQVGALMINANRNLDTYAAMGAATGMAASTPVWPDSVADYPGPLAGMLAGLLHCDTPYLVAVPCDSPLFPSDLVARLGAALAGADAELAIATTHEPGGRLQRHPVFCLMRVGLAESLRRFIGSGGRQVGAWTALHRCVEVGFDDAGAFANANTFDELSLLPDHV